MKRLAIRNLPNLGFGLAVLILFGVGVFATVNLRFLIESNNMVGHTFTVLQKLKKTLALTRFEGGFHETQR